MISVSLAVLWLEPYLSERDGIRNSTEFIQMQNTETLIVLCFSMGTCDHPLRFLIETLRMWIEWIAWCKLEQRFGRSSGWLCTNLNRVLLRYNLHKKRCMDYECVLILALDQSSRWLKNGGTLLFSNGRIYTAIVYIKYCLIGATPKEGIRET